MVEGSLHQSAWPFFISTQISAKDWPGVFTEQWLCTNMTSYCSEARFYYCTLSWGERGKITGLSKKKSSFFNNTHHHTHKHTQSLWITQQYCLPASSSSTGSRPAPQIQHGRFPRCICGRTGPRAGLTGCRDRRSSFLNLSSVVWWIRAETNRAAPSDIS